jgi:hypothetical protein
MGFEPFTKETWITKSDNPSGVFPLAPSAKTAALKSILLKGFVEAPLDKVSLLLVVPIPISSIGSLYVAIVKFNIQISWNIENSHSLIPIQVVIYVQFRALARIVGRICQSEGWGFLYLTGDLSLDNRTKAIRKFREDPEIKILIAGLKCGGLGYVSFSPLSKSRLFNVPNLEIDIPSLSQTPISTFEATPTDGKQPQFPLGQSLHLSRPLVESRCGTASFRSYLPYRSGERYVHDSYCGEELCRYAAVEYAVA